MSNQPLRITNPDQIADNNIDLSPEEQVEADRFKQLTVERAKKRAVVQRLIARLRQKDRFSKAA
jgi:hypothetical protein